VPRTVNEQEYNEKRNEILAVAQRLVYTKGYEQMTIQDLLGELQISKGAFYHYFTSKQDLLEGLIERILEEGAPIFTAILADPQLPTLARLQRFFDVMGRWKTDQKTYLLALLQVWYHDDNAIVRQKTQLHMNQMMAPLLRHVIVQGCEEGVLSTPFPEHAGSIIFALMISMGEAFARLLLTPEPGPTHIVQAERLAAAYNDALERVLGAPAGSLHVMDAPTLAEWFAVRPAQPMTI
jgi:TetR/AcrR family transcriptional repressor of nem operon